MRILVITPWVPSKRRPRSLGLIESLAKKHEVELLSAAWSDLDEADLTTIRVARTHVVRLSRITAMTRAARAVFTGASLQQAYLDSPILRARITNLIEELQPDLTYFNVLRTAQFAGTPGPGCRAIDLDEFRSAYYQQLATKDSKWLWRQLGRSEARRMRSAEERVIQQFDLILVSSPSDLIHAPEKCRLVRSPHHMPSPDAISFVDAGADGRPRIVFVGRLSYRANVEAIRWFATEVLPLIVQQYPDVILDVVGHSPHRSLRRLVSSNLDLVGAVDDVAPYYSRADVSIVPVFLATGVQMKLIESMALGVATVTTSTVAGLAGIQSHDACLVAGTASEWASAVISLLDSSDLRRKVADSGSQWAALNYSAPVIERALDTAINELLASAKSMNGDIPPDAGGSGL